MIRPITSTDIPRVAEIHVFAQRMTYQGFVSDRYLFAEATVAGRADHFAQQLGKDGREGFVLEEEGIIKGFLIVAPCNDPSCRDCRPRQSQDGRGRLSLQIERIFAEPLMLGKGIGTRLELFCRDYARKNGYEQICLWVMEDNHNARKFYEKTGYTQDGRRPSEMDAHAMQLRYFVGMAAPGHPTPTKGSEQNDD